MLFTNCRQSKLRVRKTLVSQKTNTHYCRKEARMHIYGRFQLKRPCEQKIIINMLPEDVHAQHIKYITCLSKLTWLEENFPIMETLSTHVLYIYIYWYIYKGLNLFCKKLWVYIYKENYKIRCAAKFADQCQQHLARAGRQMSWPSLHVNHFEPNLIFT